MSNVVSNLEFLVKKIKLSKEELNQDMSESKRAELLEYQDRLMDSLFEESGKIRKTNNLEDLENLLSKLEEVRN